MTKRYEMELTAKEIQLLEKYRYFDDNDKEVVETVINTLSGLYFKTWNKDGEIIARRKA